MRLVLLAGCALLVSGCFARSKTDVTLAAPADYRQRHPIVVRERDRTVELLIGAQRGALTPMQRAEVLAFAQSWKREATGGIVIEIPSETPNAAAAGGATREVRAILAAANVPPQAVALRTYRPSASDRLAAVRLNYPHMVAEAGPCGLWPSDLGPSSASYRANRQYWNFGCATQRNLAAMVADPADLVQPRGAAPAYTARRSVVLDKYRKGEQTSSTAPSNDAAKISDVGK